MTTEPENKAKQNTRIKNGKLRKSIESHRLNVV